MDDVKIMRRGQRRMRIVIEGIGVVDIDRGLTTADGNPRVRVDVVSDFDRYGLAPDGRRYTVENAEPGPGVVWVTGYLPDPEPGCEGHYDTDDALTSGVGIGEPVYCDGSCNPR